MDVIGVPCLVSKLGAREGGRFGYLAQVREVSSQLEVVTKQSKAINNTAKCSAILLKIHRWPFISKKDFSRFVQSAIYKTK